MNKGRDKEYLFYEYIITFFADADLLIQYTLRPESGQRKPLGLKASDENVRGGWAF